MSQAEGAAADGTLRICPRCGAETVQVFYGPCLSCRGDLVAKYGVAGREVVVGEQERVHRTPNFVATKD
ncbi:MAG TPA: hypothetical protein VGR20_21450 [Acidimicrobiia bacterium]|nr:hypothetical protein [Acidimicrobiia bacterium]